MPNVVWIISLSEIPRLFHGMNLCRTMLTQYTAMTVEILDELVANTTGSVVVCPHCCPVSILLHNPEIT